MGGGVGRTDLDGLPGQPVPPPSTGTDCRKLGLQVIYVCVHGGNLALGLRPHDCQIALGSRGCLFGSYQVNGGPQHFAQELIRPIRSRSKSAR